MEEEEHQLNNSTDESLQPTLNIIIPNDEEDEDDVEEIIFYDDDIGSSSCSTPFVSAPSSPTGQSLLTIVPAFYYSAPSSPMHFTLSSSSTSTSMPESSSVSTSYEFEFSARFGTVGSSSSSVYGGGVGGGSMSSADELFLNGQIRPMKLSSHLQRPQAPLEPPLLDLDDESEFNNETTTTTTTTGMITIERGRDDVKWRDRSLRRRARSMSPLRTQEFHWHDDDDDNDDDATAAADGNINNNEKLTEEEITEAVESKQQQQQQQDEPVFGETRSSSSASRNSSSSSSSKRWISLKDLLYRSKSEGRNNGHKFWSAISFSPVKDRKAPESAKVVVTGGVTVNPNDNKKNKLTVDPNDKKKNKVVGRKATNGGTVGGKKRRVPPLLLSPHEVHYKASRAQAEEMRKKTYLPYRQGLLGCLGFSSKSYGAMNGFARALNPVSSS